MAIDVKSIFADKMLELCEEKKLRDITVKDLLQATGASKQTFYNHFRDKEDLICWIYENRVLNSFHDKNLKTTYYLSCLDYANRIAKYHRFMKQAVDIQGQNCLSDFMKEYSAKYDIEWQQYHIGGKELTPEQKFALEYHSIANIEMTIRWIRSNMPESPEFIAKQATVLRRIGLGPLFYDDEGSKRDYDGI